MVMSEKLPRHVDVAGPIPEFSAVIFTPAGDTLVVSSTCGHAAAGAYCRSPSTPTQPVHMECVLLRILQWLARSKPGAHGCGRRSGEPHSCHGRSNEEHRHRVGPAGIPPSARRPDRVLDALVASGTSGVNNVALRNPRPVGAGPRPGPTSATSSESRTKKYPISRHRDFG